MLWPTIIYKMLIIANLLRPGWIITMFNDIVEVVVVMVKFVLAIICLRDSVGHCPNKMKTMFVFLAQSHKSLGDICLQSDI